jgi:hypothetical protein
MNIRNRTTLNTFRKFNENSNSNSNTNYGNARAVNRRISEKQRKYTMKKMFLSALKNLNSKKAVAMLKAGYKIPRTSIDDVYMVLIDQYYRHNGGHRSATLISIEKIIIGLLKYADNPRDPMEIVTCSMFNNKNNGYGEHLPISLIRKLVTKFGVFSPPGRNSPSETVRRLPYDLIEHRASPKIIEFVFKEFRERHIAIHIQLNNITRNRSWHGRDTKTFKLMLKYLPRSYLVHPGLIDYGGMYEIIRSPSGRKNFIELLTSLNLPVESLLMYISYAEDLDMIMKKLPSTEARQFTQSRFLFNSIEETFAGSPREFAKALKILIKYGMDVNSTRTNAAKDSILDRWQFGRSANIRVFIQTSFHPILVLVLEDFYKPLDALDVLLKAGARIPGDWYDKFIYRTENLSDSIEEGAKIVTLFMKHGASLRESDIQDIGRRFGLQHPLYKRHGPRQGRQRKMPLSKHFNAIDPISLQPVSLNNALVFPGDFVETSRNGNGPSQNASKIRWAFTNDTVAGLINRNNSRHPITRADFNPFGAKKLKSLLLKSHHDKYKTAYNRAVKNNRNN